MFRAAAALGVGSPAKVLLPLLRPSSVEGSLPPCLGSFPSPPFSPSVFGMSGFARGVLEDVALGI